ncbi:hypothetical protein GCM10010285_18270 [Streptomyces pseudogriseolus]|uniref:Uncharacterized protein n=1 Tax=Streptomyces pseudogriseolus TaxID=36817 RepID=A0ABQ2SVR6_STREZ|nr:hypothetical protein GCM10010285_18270 [Streptomyces rubiginosus]
MFAGAAADDEDLHGGQPNGSRRGSFVRASERVERERLYVPPNRPVTGLPEPAPEPVSRYGGAPPVRYSFVNSSTTVAPSSRTRSS